jgi:hypothetical protein
MNRYDPRTPRTHLVAFAVAMSALTVGLLVAAPAYTTSDDPAEGTVAATKPDSREPTLVVIEPSHTHVVGVRAKNVAMTDPATAHEFQFVARQPSDARQKTPARHD